MLIGGRYLLRPVFRFIAASVCGKCSPPRRCCWCWVPHCLGCAGVVDGARYVYCGCATGGSEYRHELETAIDPFKGLLLVCSLSLSACHSTSGCFIPICVGSDKCGCAGGGENSRAVSAARLYGVRSSERMQFAGVLSRAVSLPLSSFLPLLHNAYSRRPDGAVAGDGDAFHDDHAAAMKLVDKWLSRQFNGPEEEDENHGSTMINRRLLSWALGVLSGDWSFADGK